MRDWAILCDLTYSSFLPVFVYFQEKNQLLQLVVLLKLKD